VAPLEQIPIRKFNVLDKSSSSGSDDDQTANLASDKKPGEEQGPSREQPREMSSYKSRPSNIHSDYKSIIKPRNEHGSPDKEFRKRPTDGQPNNLLREHLVEQSSDERIDRSLSYLSNDRDRRSSFKSRDNQSNFKPRDGQSNFSSFKPGDTASTYQPRLSVHDDASASARKPWEKHDDKLQDESTPHQTRDRLSSSSGTEKKSFASRDGNRWQGLGLSPRETKNSAGTPIKTRPREQVIDEMAFNQKGLSTYEKSKKTMLKAFKLDFAVARAPPDRV
jgi:hypothetical protein